MASSSLDRNRVIVVDDTSADIQYTGPWFLDTSGSQDPKGNFGPVFNATLHGVENGPASLVYAFTGNQIEVLGTNDILNQSGILNPSWECFVDGNSIPVNPYQWPENNWVLCASPQLQHGTHVLTVNASVNSPQTFWIDQIRYIPSLTSQFTTATVYVNSTDLAIQSAFGEGWIASVGSSNLTTVNPSTFTLEFTGVSLSWYGIIPEKTPLLSTTGSYSVDGSGDSHAFFIQGLADGPFSDTTYNIKYFETSLLPAGKHRLVVTYNGNSSTAPFTLDYLIIQNASVPLRVASSSSTPASTTPSLSDTKVIMPVNGTSTINLNAAVPSTSSNAYTAATFGAGPTAISPGHARTINTTAIAGYISGGFGVAVILTLAFVLVRRCKLARKAVGKSQIVTPTPFQRLPDIDTRFRPDGTKIRQD